jgi:Mor family transcriptional regulator
VASDPVSKTTAELSLVHTDLVDRVAIAIEETMFAEHEFPLDPELHQKYRMTAREAIAVVRQWDAGK